jgi:hypothetical protein
MPVHWVLEVPPAEVLPVAAPGVDVLPAAGLALDALPADVPPPDALSLEELPLVDGLAELELGLAELELGLDAPLPVAPLLAPPELCAQDALAMPTKAAATAALMTFRDIV